MQVIYSSVSKTKRGNRIFIEGKKLASLGFMPSSKYSIDYDKGNKNVTLQLNEEGDKVVSKRSRYNEDLPVIDICNNSLAEMYDEGTKVVIRVKENKIIISIQEVQRNQTIRELELVEKIKSDIPLNEGSLCTGGGISTHAIHSGLEAAGVKAKVTMIAELDPRYLQVAERNFPDLEMIHQCKIEEVEFCDIPKLDILSFSLPCTGHSIAGKAARGLDSAEEHPDAATSVFGALRYIVKSNPAILISENVVQAKDSATYILLKSELNRIGYRIEEFILDEKQAGSLERRKRYWFIAISKGLNVRDLSPAFFEKKIKNVGQIVDKENSEWIPLDYFDKREAKNKENGRGFSKNFVTESDESVGVIIRGYNKRQVSNPHFTNGKQIRLFSVKEHARIKGIPEKLVDDLSPTVGHEILGQSILYNHAYGLAMAIGETLKAIKNLLG